MLLARQKLIFFYLNGGDEWGTETQPWMAGNFFTWLGIKLPFNTFPSLPKENKKNSATSKSPASGTPTLRPEDVTLPQKSVILKILWLNLVTNYEFVRFLISNQTGSW